ncbi:hypothetical protein [Ectothiorhodospira variabilis]|uniref:hypothetical protein n=1 Tax=Ectothiorhodospira variabilis TaxID=505694 RepID=UPI001EFB239A|nr:hypothetical protein [Ectothiorhodospira variabilis]MCG5497499.1 hypothetical protein [Ectothiorhodospira variabilis]
MCHLPCGFGAASERLGLGLVLVARFMTAEVLAQGRLLTCLDFWRAPIDFLVARFAGG